jgi:hypothetical protein
MPSFNAKDLLGGLWRQRSVAGRVEEHGGHGGLRRLLPSRLRLPPHDQHYPPHSVGSYLIPNHDGLVGAGNLHALALQMLLKALVVQPSISQRVSIANYGLANTTTLTCTLQAS